MADIVRECLLRLIEDEPLQDLLCLINKSMLAMFDGSVSSPLTVAFLTALKMRGDCAEVIATCASALQHKVIECPVGDVVDIVGTGGDGHDTFNVSTTAGIVCAGAGLRVAKFGNRASSSSCGSADILESGLGANLMLDPADVSRILDRCGFCFIFAQQFLPLMKHVAVARREMGCRTLFNYLGPISSPARPSVIVLGVYTRSLGHTMANALICNNIKRALVVCGQEGLDEISPAGPTDVWEVREGTLLEEYSISPDDFGLQSHPLTEVIGADPTHNAAVLVSLLEGKASAILDYVLLNSAALLYVAGKATSWKDGVRIARDSIASGKALSVLNNYVKASNERK